MLSNYYQVYDFLTTSIDELGIIIHMKNAARMASFVLVGTKVTLFCYFYRHLIELIF